MSIYTESFSVKFVLNVTTDLEGFVLQKPACHPFPALLRGSRVSQALLVDLGIERVPLLLVDGGLFPELGLALVHVGLVFEESLMDNLILLLLGLKAILVASVIFELLNDGIPSILSAHQLVLHLDGPNLALVNQLLVLVVADLPLGAGFQLLIPHLLDHCRVGVKVLPLQLDLLELLGKTLLLGPLVLFLFTDFVVDLLQALVASRLYLRFVLLLLKLLLVALLLILLPAHLPRLLDLGRLIHQLFRLLLLAHQIVFPLSGYLLLPKHLVILKPLPQLGDRHLVEEPVSARLCRVEPLRPDDRYPLKLSDLPNELLASALLDLLFLLPALECLRQLLVDLVTDTPLLFLDLLHLLRGVVFLGENSLDDFLLLVEVLLEHLVFLDEFDLHLLLHLCHQKLVFPAFLFLSIHGCFPGQLHLNLLL